MMSRVSLAALGLLVSAGLQAETLRVTDLDIDKVRVEGSVEVQVSQGDQTELLVRGDSDDLEKRPFYTRDSILVLGHSRDHKGEKFSSVKYMLTVPDLSEVRLSGNGDVFVKPMNVSDLLISVEGSGDVKVFELTAENVRVRVAGSGDIKIAQLSSPILDLMVSGSGDIAIGKLEADAVEATISGSGDIKVAEATKAASAIDINIIGGGGVNLSPLAADSAEINIIGSGDIYYAGDPEIDPTILGSGDLNRQR